MNNKLFYLPLDGWYMETNELGHYIQYDTFTGMHALRLMHLMMRQYKTNVSCHLARSKAVRSNRQGSTILLRFALIFAPLSVSVMLFYDMCAFLILCFV